MGKGHGACTVAQLAGPVGQEEVLPCSPLTPKCSLLCGELGWLQLGTQGGCAPVVCPSWKGIGVEMEHADLLAPPWAGCLLTCCQHSHVFAGASPASALPFLAKVGVFFRVPIPEEGSGGEFAMFSSSPHDLDMSAPSTPLPVNIRVRLGSALWGFPAMPPSSLQGWGCPSLAVGSCWAGSASPQQMGRWSWLLGQVSGHDKAK